MRVAERLNQDRGELSFAAAFSPALLDPQSETARRGHRPERKGGHQTL